MTHRTFVYVIAPNGGPAKLGIAQDVDKRLVDLQVGSPVQLYCWAAFEFKARHDARQAEVLLHRRLESRRLVGEWFKGTPSEFVAILRRELSAEPLFVRSVVDKPAKKRSGGRHSSRSNIVARPPAVVSSTEPTLEEIRHGLQTAARVALLYGDQYMPIVERLETEVAKREAATSRRERLRVLAEGGDRDAR